MAYRPTALRPNRGTDDRTDRTAPVDNTTLRSDAIRHATVTARRLSAASAALILVGGYVHLCLYRHGYRFIPKIGVGFLLQAISSAVLAAVLLVNGGRSLALAQVARLSAIALSLGTLAALGVAHTSGGLFQFREIGLRPAPQTLIAIITESLATLLLGLATLQGLRTTPSQAISAGAAVRSRRSSRSVA
jgi:hypothetical protein